MQRLIQLGGLVPTIYYGGDSFRITVLEARGLHERVLEITNSGRFEVLEFGGAGSPTRVLVGPGIPIMIGPDNLRRS